MKGAIFLSASVPDPMRDPGFAKTADTVAITSAISALLHVILGRRQLVWGGHPAITPMIWVVAEDLGVDYGKWVHLYQSSYFKDEYPEDNDRYSNVTYTRVVDHDRNKSLYHMRTKMLTDYRYSAAIFIGGMRGVIDEFNMFRELQPHARLIPVGSTGGAALEIAKSARELNPQFVEDLDYTSLFCDQLQVSLGEERDRILKATQQVVVAPGWKPPEPM